MGISNYDADRLQRQQRFALLQSFEFDNTTDDIGDIPLTEEIIKANNFSLRQLYRSHMPVSENIVCKVCGKSITKKLGFIDHLKMHTGDYIGHCRYCGRGVTRPNHLKTHENRCAIALLSMVGFVFCFFNNKTMKCDLKLFYLFF